MPFIEAVSMCNIAWPNEAAWGTLVEAAGATPLE